MSVKTSEDLQEFIHFYTKQRDHIDYKQKEVLDRIIHQEQVVDFKYQLTEWADHVQLTVYCGNGEDAMVINSHLHLNVTYCTYTGHDAVDRLEELLDNGKLADLSKPLVLCVNALLGVVDDDVMAELNLSVTEKNGIITGLFAQAFNELITIQY